MRNVNEVTHEKCTVYGSNRPFPTVLAEKMKKCNVVRNKSAY